MEVIVFLVTFYILFFVALTNPPNLTVRVPDITASLFDKLRLEYGETLSCPCSTTTVPYRDFVSYTISFHPVCSSVFISKEWIEALYLEDRSAFLVMDFRTTASSQVISMFTPNDVVDLNNRLFLSISMDISFESRCLQFHILNIARKN